MAKITRGPFPVGIDRAVEVPVVVIVEVAATKASTSVRVFLVIVAAILSPTKMVRAEVDSWVLVTVRVFVAILVTLTISAFERVA